MAPEQATKAYQQGKLREGALVHQPYGFLRGERKKGRVLSVDCRTDGVVCGVTVRWPDEDTPVYAHIDDLDLPGEADKLTLRARVKNFFTCPHIRPQK